MLTDFAAAAPPFRVLEAVDDATRLLRAVAVGLTAVTARTTAVATAADWSAPSARVFGDRADDLRHRLAGAEAAADDLVADLRHVRAVSLLQGAAS